MPSDPAIPAYPSDHAWLWDWPGVGDCMLSRREAAVVDAMARHPAGPMTVAEVKEATDAAMAPPPAPAGHRGILARAGEAALGALAAAGTMSLPALHAVMASLGDKGLAEPTGDRVYGPGRASRSWALTPSGSAAASLVAAMGRAAADRADPEGRGARLAREALEAIRSVGSVQGVVDSEGRGYRVLAVVDGAYATVARGTPDGYDALQADVEARIAAHPGPFGPSQHFVFHGPGLDLRVEVAWQPHPLGMRIVLVFWPLPDAPTAGSRPGRPAKA